MKVNLINQPFLMTLGDCISKSELHKLTESLWIHYIAVIVSRITAYDEKSNLYEVEK